MPIAPSNRFKVMPLLPLKIPKAIYNNADEGNLILQRCNLEMTGEYQRALCYTATWYLVSMK